MSMRRPWLIVMLFVVACGPSTPRLGTTTPSAGSTSPSAPASSPTLSAPTPSPPSPLIVVADTDSSGVTHNLKLYDLGGTLVATLPVTPDVWPLAAAGKRIFVQKSNRLEAIDRTGSIEDLGPLTVGPNEQAFLVPSPDGTHWLQTISHTNSNGAYDLSTIHEAGDGMSDRVVATGTSNSPLYVYAWTSAAVLISHYPSFSFGISAVTPFAPRWPIVSVDALDIASGVLTPIAGSIQCQPGDISAHGVYACFVRLPNDSSDASHLLRLIPSSGQPMDIQLPQPQFTEAGCAWFSPTGRALTLAGWDGNGHFNYPGQLPTPPPVGIHTYLVDVTTGKVTPFGPEGAQPALAAQSWLPGGQVLLQRKIGATGGDPGLFILDANGQGPFIRDPGQPMGIIS
jgi:hypothetical protein